MAVALVQYLAQETLHAIGLTSPAKKRPQASLLSTSSRPSSSTRVRLPSALRKSPRRKRYLPPCMAALSSSHPLGPQSRPQPPWDMCVPRHRPAPRCPAFPFPTFCLQARECIGPAHPAISQKQRLHVCLFLWLVLKRGASTPSPQGIRRCHPPGTSGGHNQETYPGLSVQSVSGGFLTYK